MLKANGAAGVRPLLSSGSLIAIGAALFASIGAHGAMAQVQAPPAAAAPTAPVSIGEVVVTAQRKEESIQKVPVAVSAISAAQLERENITSADDIQFHVPELQVNPSQYLLNAEPSFTLRGLSTTVPGTTIADASVASYFGDAPLLYNRDIGHGLFDLKDVQVLRGPQGTLFGKNSTGGAVIFDPAKPTDLAEGLIQATGGDYALGELTAMINVPISDKVQVRFAGKVGRRDGYTRNLLGADLDDENFQAGRLSVMIKPTDWFQNYTMFDREHSHEHIVAKVATAVGGPALIFYSGSGQTGFFENPNLGSQADVLNQFARQQQLGHRTVASPWPNFVDIDAYTMNNVSTVRLNDDLTFKNIVSYQHSTSLFVLASGELQYNFAAPLVNPDKASQISEEAQLLGKSFNHDLDWVLGVFYSHQDDQNVNTSTIFTDYNPFITPIYPAVQIHNITAASTDDATAVYGHASYDLGHFLPGLKFNAGYRYTWDDRRLDLNSIATNANLATFFVPPFMITGCALPTATPPACLTNFTKTFQSPSWTVGMDYQVNPNLMAYVVGRHGFKSGGFNATTGIPGTQQYDPEKMTDIEVGVKADWRIGGMPLRTNIALYDGMLDNPTIPLLVVYQGQIYQVLENVKGAEIYGGEFEFNFKPTPQLQISGSYSLTASSYDSGASIVTAYGPAPSDPTKAVPTATQDLSGTPIAQSSRHTAQVSVFYDFNIDPKYGDLNVEADYAWRSKQLIPGQGAGCPAACTNGVLPSFGVVNLRAELDKIGGRPVDLAVWVKNAADEQYLTSEQLFKNVLGLDNVTYGAPRQFGATLSFRW